MADSTSQKRVTRGSAANTTAERRTKIRNDTLKKAQVEKSSKESTLPVAKKRKKPMDDASSVKGKEVDARNSSDTRDEKEIKLFVKHPPISSPHISSYTNTDIVSDLKVKLTPATSYISHSGIREMGS
ncbi:uncharacterized protein [Nicotiana tomentosiformis]|uniref:uncharacterized protein n=1 Tax=Nicotiana tomentosiformis TaxID=4098 RepID=UPI000878C112